MKSKKIVFYFSIVVTIFILHYTFIGYKAAEQLEGISNSDTSHSYSNQIKSEERNDFIKNNEDIINADYKVFYDDLVPYGTWIEVNLNDKASNTNLTPEKDNLSEVLRNILGIKDAVADINMSWNIMYVWKPAPNMAVSLIAGETEPMYSPYTNGRWVYSDYGWYFKAATPYEEITHHYGRWVFVNSQGWIWIPGNTWSPAWVSWNDDDYISWTPYTNGIYSAASYYGTSYSFEPRYVICERRHFLEPVLYKYSITYRENDKGFKYKEKYISRNYFKESYKQSYGPDLRRFKHDEINRNNTIRINMVSQKNMVKYEDKKFNVYTPFKNIRKDFEIKTASHKNEQKNTNINNKERDKYDIFEKNKSISKGKSVERIDKGNNRTKDHKGNYRNGDRENKSQIKNREKKETPNNIIRDNSGNRKNDKENRFSDKDKRNGFQPERQKQNSNNSGKEKLFKNKK